MIERLAADIKKYRELYYEGNPEISDEEFDGLVLRLKELSPDHSVLKEIGAPVKGKEIIHTTPMKSLDTVHTHEDFIKWAKVMGEGLIGEPKLDGLTIVLTYKNGKFIHAATRGDGFSGELIGYGKSIKGVPSTLKENIDIEIRGEGIVSKKYAESVGAANPRNLAVGLIKRKDGGVGIKNVTFKAFQLVNGHGEATEIEELFRLRDLGFDVVDHNLIQDKNHALEFFTKWEEKRPNLDFDIDGMVFKYNRKIIQESLGENENYPKWAIAWKFKSEKAITVVEGMVYKTGKTGRVVPVLQVRPVKLTGAVCVNVTANNFGFIRENQIGIGTELLLERAGDVIPHVVKITKPIGNVHIPEDCPSCGTSLIWDGPNLICCNDNCSAKKLALIQHWIDKMEIEWFGPAAQKALIDAGYVEDVSDIYQLTEETFRKIVGDGMGKKIYASIQEKKHCELWQFLTGLGIHNLGNRLSKQLAKRWNSIDDIIENLEGANIEGMGVIKGRIVRELKRRRVEILKLYSQMKIEDKANKKGGSKMTLSGNFCITGTLSLPRKEIQAMIEENGGTVVSSVSKNLDYLVAGDKCGSKLSKANKLGVTVLVETDLMEMIG
jgi:DNA ligase (NAD+)